MKIKWSPIASEVETIHYSLVEMFQNEDEEKRIDPPGIKTLGLLESACSRPNTSFGQTIKYKSVEAKAAALFHSLVKNHPFHNGNKRTALATLILYLYRNGKRFKKECSDKDIYNLVVHVADNSFFKDVRDNDGSIKEIQSWIKKNTTSVNNNPTDMTVDQFVVNAEKAGVKVKKNKSGVHISNPNKNKSGRRIHSRTKKLSGKTVMAYAKKLAVEGMLVDEFREGVNPEQEEILRFKKVLFQLALT